MNIDKLLTQLKQSNETDAQYVERIIKLVEALLPHFKFIYTEWEWDDVDFNLRMLKRKPKVTYRAQELVATTVDLLTREDFSIYSTHIIPCLKIN
jgi:hypothetical protein